MFHPCGENNSSTARPMGSSSGRSLSIESFCDGRKCCNAVPAPCVDANHNFLSISSGYGDDNADSYYEMNGD